MVYDILENPTLKDVERFVQEYGNSRVILLHLNCRVDYDGRAKSVLDYGDRILMLKPDGSVLVHSREKREPVNWQPPGSVLSVFLREGNLVIKSLRRRPKEVLTVTSSKVYVALACECSDGENFTLWFSEAEMVDKVFDNPELIEDGFKPLKREVSTPFGSVDLIGLDKSGNPVVLEFKRATAQLQAVSQLKRYVDYFTTNTQKVRGIIVAPGITPSALRLLRKYGLEFVRLDPRS